MNTPSREQSPAPDSSPTTRSEAVAQFAESLLDLLWEQTPDYALVLIDREGVVVGWRGAAASVLGYTEHEALGKPISFIFTDEDRERGIPLLERMVAASDGRSEDDRWHLRKDGTRIWVIGAMVALRKDGAVIGFAKVLRDRTDLRVQIETLKNRGELADKQLQERDVFFARLTHEVRNSLGPMRNATELMGRIAAPEQLKFPLAIVKRQLGLMERMISDLAEVARVGVGKLQLSKQSFDLAADLLEIADASRGHAQVKQQELMVHVPASPVMICADRERVHQIAFNLMDNAIKYTPNGGRIWLKCTLEGDRAVFRVQDTGIGISAEMLPLIFDLFTQEAPAQSEGGFGVGLSLVKDLVNAHGGVVTVRSDGKGNGSEFTVRLPVGLESG